MGISLFGRISRKLFWSFNRHSISLFLKKKYNLTLSESADPIPEGPFIMVSNHANFFDPWIVAHYSSLPVSIMMNEGGFNASPMTRWYLNSIGAFPKKKGSSDMQAMKISLKRLRDGYPLLIFPEGQTTWDGETQPIFSGIEKLVKKSKLPLVMCNLEGHFLSRPWWNTGGDRKGKILVNRKVVSADEIQSMKVAEIRDMMIHYIKGDDINSDTAKEVSFIGDNVAEGLERVIWHCPACASEDTLSFKGNVVTCGDCNNSFTYNANMCLEEYPEESDVKNLHDWVGEEKAIALSKLNSVEDLTLAEDALVSQIRVDYSGRVIMLDTGRLVLTRDVLIFYGEDGTQVFETQKILTPVFQNKDMLEFEYDGSSYMFQIQKTAVYKWLTYLRYMTGYRECEERGYM